MLQKNGASFPARLSRSSGKSSVKTAFSQKSPYIVRLSGLSATAGMIGERLFGKYGVDNCGYFFAALFGLRQTDINPIFMVKAVMDGEVISAAAFATGNGFGAGGA